MTEIRDNPGLQRYELEVEGRLAIAAYERRGGAIVFTHTVVPQQLQGQGVASRLIKAVLTDVRRQGLKVVPICEFVSAYLDRHTEDQDLIAADAPG
jgi:predicted GNAT family acetyltransferase